MNKETPVSGGETTLQEVIPDASMIRLYYAARFEPEQFAKLAAAASSLTWKTGKGKILNVWERAEKQYNMSESIPRARGLFLAPETPEGQEIAQVHQMNKEALNAPWGLAQRSSSWELYHRKSDTWLPFNIGKLDLILSRDGIAVLMLEVTSLSSSFDDWQNLAVELTWQKNDQIRVDFREDKGSDRFMNGSGVNQLGKKPLTSMLEQLLAHLSPKKTTAPWWKADVFAEKRLFPWVYITCPTSDIGVSQKRLWALTNLYGSAHKALTDGFSDIPDHPDYIMAAGEWCNATQESLVILQTQNHTKDNRQERFNGRIKRSYGLMILHGLLQRWTIERLATEVTEGWGWHSSDKKRAQVFDNLQQQSVRFMAQGLVSRVYHQHRYQNFFKYLRTRWEVETEYARLASKVNELEEHLALRQSREFESFVKTGGVLLGLLSLVISVLGVNIVGLTTSTEGLDLAIVLNTIAFIAGSSVVCAGLYFYLKTLGR